MFVDVEGTKSVRVMNKPLKIAYLKYISVLISLFRLHGPFEASLYAESDSWSEVGRRRKGGREGLCGFIVLQIIKHDLKKKTKKQARQKKAVLDSS